MTRLAQTERTALCDTALQVGEAAPTLCGDWSVKDLVVHLVVRERSPGAVGIVVAPLAPLTDLASRRLARTGFAVLVERVRTGPPVWSPMAAPPVDAAVNALEYFVHHEDIRRAQPGWTARDLGAAAEQRLWSALRPLARVLTRGVPGGLTLEDSTTGATRVVRAGAEQAVVTGRPSEIALYLYGREEQADVRLGGDRPDAVATTPLGL